MYHNGATTDLVCPCQLGKMAHSQIGLHGPSKHKEGDFIYAVFLKYRVLRTQKIWGFTIPNEFKLAMATREHRAHALER